MITINTITQIHEVLGLGKPKHPLVTLIHHKDYPRDLDFGNAKFVVDLYQISMKEGVEGYMGYGRNTYDFQEGTMIFTKPGQVITAGDKEFDEDPKGWSLMFHPDLIRRSALAKNISQYTFFSYDVHEALHLSDEEKQLLTNLVNTIESEYQNPIDKHSQKLIVSNVELLLDYCMRYYDRQFYLRTNLNQDVITKFEAVLEAYYNSDKPQELGVPSVKYCGEALNMSPNYLSDLLKKETGSNAKEHIHRLILNKAKNRLLGTTNSIGEIAYSLGFEYPQHFSKLFKSKSGMSPAQYRRMN